MKVMRSKIHPAWLVAAVTTLTLLMAAAFRSTTGVLIQPIEADTGWSRDVISSALVGVGRASSTLSAYPC